VLTFMQIRKQLDSCGFGVPALKRVGDACVIHRWLSKVYVDSAAPMSFCRQRGQGHSAQSSCIACEISVR
jgi:hypothetical protein